MPRLSQNARLTAISQNTALAVSGTRVTVPFVPSTTAVGFMLLAKLDTGSGGFPRLFGWFAGNSGYRFIWNTGAVHYFTFDVGNGAGYISCNAASIVWQTDTWYHITVNYSVPQARVFVNAAEIGNNNVGICSAPTDLTPALCSEADGGFAMNGKIARFVARNGTAFTQAEIDDHYFRDITPAGATVAYKFNEGNGTTVTDYSGNGYHGTVTNGSWTTTQLPSNFFPRISSY